MIICINCDRSTKNKLDSILKEHDYSDYSELIAVAVANLWALHQESPLRGAVLNSEGTQARPSVLSQVSSKRPSLGVPALFQSVGWDAISITGVDIPPETENATEVFTVDRWLFGQYNRLLPAKANCRALARLVAEHPEGVPLAEAGSRIADTAALLGDYLLQHDDRHQIGRDEALATAFPRTGPDGEKGRLRYASQFVGSVNSQNALSGLLWDYRLVTLGGGMGVALMDHGQDAPATSTPRLLLTEPAVQFARLENPALDGCQSTPTQKFSSEETAFLLDHIRSFVPVEQFAFASLLRAITDGADTPDKLNEALQSLRPADSNRSLSPSFLASQRSGALSRMADLGLIARERKGVRVSYVVTQEGKHFIEPT